MAERQGVAARAPDDQPERQARETAWLLQIAQRGPQLSHGLQQLTAAYGPKVLSFCMRRGMSKAEAEELQQNLWMRIAAHAEDFEPGRKPSTWIWAIARRLLIDELRKTSRRHEVTQGDDFDITMDARQLQETANRSTAGDSIVDCVHRGLLRYADIHLEGAMAVLLRDLEGWNITELAQFLERTEGATRTFLSQVRKKLQPFLEPCFELLSN